MPYSLVGANGVCLPVLFIERFRLMANPKQVHVYKSGSRYEVHVWFKLNQGTNKHPNLNYKVKGKSAALKSAEKWTQNTDLTIHYFDQTGCRS